MKKKIASVFSVITCIFALAFASYLLYCFRDGKIEFAPYFQKLYEQNGKPLVSPEPQREFGEIPKSQCVQGEYKFWLLHKKSESGKSSDRSFEWKQHSIGPQFGVKHFFTEKGGDYSKENR